MENKQCYKCLKLLTRIESNSGSMCLVCHSKMLEKYKKDVKEMGECCDYNGQLYWF